MKFTNENREKEAYIVMALSLTCALSIPMLWGFFPFPPVITTAAFLFSMWFL
jgi:hypothetical protein